MFSLVTFVDTAGLVAGDSHYPFDVNEAILWLGKSASFMGVISEYLLTLSFVKLVCYFLGPKVKGSFTFLKLQ